MCPVSWEIRPRKVSLHDGIPGDVVRGAVYGTPVMIHYFDALRRQHGDVSIGQEKNLPGVLQERGNVAGDKIFTLAEPDHGGGPQTSRNDFVRIFRGQEHQRVNSAQFLQ